MPYLNIIRTSFFLLFLLPSLVWSQTSTSSPYSRFGLGELYYPGSAISSGMGGVAYGLQNDTLVPFYLVTANPSSLGSTRHTTFEVGLTNSTNFFETTKGKSYANRVSLTQMVLGIPMSRKNVWGMALGIQPFSSVGYNIGSSQEVDSVGTVRYNYQGSGGISELFMAHGFAIKNLNIGFSVGYLFGSIQHTYRDSFPSNGLYFNTRMVTTTHVNDFYFKTGAQYKFVLGKWNASLGITAGLPTVLNTKNSSIAELLKFNSLIEISRDTALFIEDEKGEMDLPLMLGGGFVLKNDKWLFGADYTMQDWTNDDFPGLFGKSDKISAGVQFTPKRKADITDPYFKKMSYRFGGSFGHSYLQLNQATPLQEMMVSFGTTFPLRSNKVPGGLTQSMVNLSLQLGQRGTIENNLVKENFVRVNLVISFDHKWFNIRKYD
jgi:hypothetical protein